MKTKNLNDEKDDGKSLDDLKSVFGIIKPQVYQIINERKSILAKIDGNVDQKKKYMKIAEASKTWEFFQSSMEKMSIMAR